MKNHKGTYRNLELGKTYTLSIGLSNGHRLTTTGHRFIQVTPKGFNFLDVQKHKCIFDKHFYRSNKNKKFFIIHPLTVLEENV
jgi:hypothetical protein